MKITIEGEYSLHEALQALYEKLHELEDEHGIRYVRNMTIYLTPTNGFGDEVEPRDEFGRAVKDVRSRGPYRPFADSFRP